MAGSGRGVFLLQQQRKGSLFLKALPFLETTCGILDASGGSVRSGGHVAHVSHSYLLAYCIPLHNFRYGISEFSALIKLYRNWEVVHPIILPKRNHLSSNHISPPLFLRRYLPRNEMVMLACAVHTGLPDQAYREYKSKTPQRYHRARGKNHGCITASPCEFFSCGAFS
jgi:hypothetical protein